MRNFFLFFSFFCFQKLPSSCSCSDGILWAPGMSFHPAGLSQLHQGQAAASLAGNAAPAPGIRILWNAGGLVCILQPPHVFPPAAAPARIPLFRKLGLSSEGWRGIPNPDIWAPDSCPAEFMPGAAPKFWFFEVVLMRAR